MSRKTALSLCVLLACLAVAASGWQVVPPGERIVVRRFGRALAPDREPGLHWGFPLGIDRVQRVRTDLVRRLHVGVQPAGSTAAEDRLGAEFLTGDLNLVRMGAVVQFRVEAPADLVLRSVDAEALLTRLAESSLSRVTARRGIDEVLRSGRQQMGAEVARDLDREVARLHLGLKILGVSLTEVRPPVEVAADFSAAQSAESERDRRRHEASTRAETTVTAARATASARLQNARAAAERSTLTARSQAQRFLTVLAEAGRAPELSAGRIYMDLMKELLHRVRRKVILAPGENVDLTVLGVPE